MNVFSHISRKCMSALLITSFLVPSLSWAKADSDIETVASIQASIDTSPVIQEIENLNLSKLINRIENRLEKNYSRLNKKFSNMSNKRAEKLLAGMQNTSEKESNLSAKERLMQMTDKDHLSLAKKTVRAHINQNCSASDSASSCLSKLRKEHAEVSKQSDRSPASISAPAIVIFSLFLIGGVVLAVLTGVVFLGVILVGIGFLAAKLANSSGGFGNPI